MNYRIEKTEFNVPEGKRYGAIAYQATPKARYFKEKIVFNYYFKTEEARDKYVTEFVEAKNKRQAENEAYKQEKRAAKKNAVNPFKVGDIVYDSWGYDQTNIDFYQITEVGKMSVKIREIGQKLVRDAGWLCEYVTADPGQFTGEEMTKILQVDYYDGKTTVYIKSRHGSISLWNGKEKYQSHYA